MMTEVNDLNKVYYFKDDIDYPSFENFYSPQHSYPEYIWPEDISNVKNDVYQAIRETLIALNLDKENFGSNKWNPLEDFISIGDTVLVKPNWVSNKNNNPDAGLDCLVTHTSVLRCILDYCVIALKGSGKIIIGDAPIQGADLEDLLITNHVYELIQFYKIRGVDIEIDDFRLLKVYGKNGVYNQKKEINSYDDTINVNLSSKSKFSEFDKFDSNYHVMDYSVKKTKEYHTKNNHIYNINKKVLEADVIINLPKPKCHKLAGVTGALKNMVGIVADKACLPHDSLGSKSKQGDSYPGRSIIKASSNKIREYKTEFEDKHYYMPALFAKYIDYALRYMIRRLNKNQYYWGAWHGNDTIWRTVLDLNSIVEYADKNGIIQSTPQRKLFHFADMIIAGDLEGPLSPSPKKTGIFVAGTDASLVDALITKIMGFDVKKIPTIYDALLEKHGTLFEEIKIGTNEPANLNRTLKEVSFPLETKFRPNSGWVGNIELGDE